MNNSFLICGASRGTGAWVAQYALAKNYKCTALVRNDADAIRLQEKGCHVVVGDACNASSVEQACSAAGMGCTIISTMGGENVNYQGHRILIDSAVKTGIKRMILVTSLGCGNSWAHLSLRAKAAFGHSVREKSLAENWLQTSILDYCILRPGGLIDGQASFNAQCFAHTQEVHGFISRCDLAHVILEKAMLPLLGSSIYAVIDPKVTIERA